MAEERVGPYRIVEKIAETGQAISYKAEHEHLHRYVFLKILPGTINTTEERRNRFLQEARALARVDHPAVVRVYDAGEFNGKLYLASEFLTGPDMHTYIAESGALSWERVREIAHTLLEGLKAIHEAGIVHRDIKPSNIVFGTHGPKLADFGLARIADNPQGTRSDTFIGTPAYIAPEILGGEQATPRSDLFAFGGTLFELLTGARAFRGETFQAVLARILDHDPIETIPPEIPGEGRRFLRILLEKDPRRRPADAGEALDSLDGHGAQRKELKIARMLPMALPVIVALTYLFVVMPAQRDRDPVSSNLQAESTVFRNRIPDTSMVGSIFADTSSGPISAPHEPTVDTADSTSSEQVVSDSAEPLTDEPDTGPGPVAGSAAGPDSMLLWIFSTPWAEISLNDSVIDTTPLADPLFLHPGNHTFTFRHPAFLSISRHIEVSAGGTESLNVAMQESTSFFRMSAEPWATVEIDGKAGGMTPFPAPIPVRPGHRRIVMRNPYHGERVDSLFFAPGETVGVSIRFENEKRSE